MYNKTGYKEVELKEVGPRFEMRLFQVSPPYLSLPHARTPGPRFEMRLFPVAFEP